MRISDVETAALLPSWMRGDPANEGLAAACDEVVRAMADDIAPLTIWNRIEDLPEPLLDELAGALDIEWWDPAAPIEAKRTLVRQSDLVHAKKGTCAAVESVIRAYFGDGRVEEWFEYGGEPHHYRIRTDNPTLVHEHQAEFMALLAKVARKSSKLDSITIGLEQKSCLFSGLAYRSSERVHVAMPRRGNRVETGLCVSVLDHVTVEMTGRSEE